jgi:Tol biopolymer transport system component
MRRPWLRVAPVLLLAATATACGGSSSPLKSACGGYSDLLVTSHPTRGVPGGREVLIVHPDGTGTKVLSGKGVAATDPAFSPDGEQVVFVLADGTYGAGGPDATHLATLGINGKGQRQITGTSGDHARVFDEEPDWSATGDVIAFTRRETLTAPDPSGATSTRRIYVVRPGTAPSLFVSNAIDDQDSSPAWSPDGNQLAFVRTSKAWSRHPSSSVFIVTADGKSGREVAPLPGKEAFPQLGLTWSPDSKQLFVGSGTLALDAPVRSIDLADGATKVVAPTGAELVWSQDGTRLYSFTRGAPGNARAWRLTTVRLIDGLLTDVHESAYALNSDVDGLDVARCPN